MIESQQNRNSESRGMGQTCIDQARAAYRSKLLAYDELNTSNSVARYARTFLYIYEYIYIFILILIFNPIFILILILDFDD